MHVPPAEHVPPLPQLGTSHGAPGFVPPLHASRQLLLPGDGHVPLGQSASEAQAPSSFGPPTQREHLTPWVGEQVPPGQCVLNVQG